MSLVKEIILSLVSCLVVLIALSIGFYRFIPNNKVIPETVSYQASEEIKNASLLIFNEDLSTVERPTLSCLESDNFVIKGIKKAEADDNYLYIYEYFGYVVKSDETYNIYTNSLANESLTSYNVTENFTNTDSLKEYKWTYKRVVITIIILYQLLR